MLYSNRWIVVWLIVALVYQQSLEPASGTNKHAKVEHIQGTDIMRVTLTLRATERLGIETTLVRDLGDETMRKVIPYASVLYDVHGDVWTYTNPKPLVFVRYPIVVDYIDGDLAILLKGPPSRTAIVTVGVAELYGVEKGIGK